MRTATAPIALALGFAPFAAAAQDRIEGPAWDLLASIDIEEIVTDTTYEVRKLFPAEVIDGIPQFDITGYVVPLSDDPAITDLIIVSDMGFCPFCGSPEHGTSLLVSMAEPLAGYEYGERITLRGALEAVTDPETWQTTVLTGARVM